MLPKTGEENKVEKMGVEEDVDLGLVESKGVGQIHHETKRGLSSRHIQMIATIFSSEPSGHRNSLIFIDPKGDTSSYLTNQCH